MALFVRGVSGPDYRACALAAATDLLDAAGYGTAEGPWIPLGVGVNAGSAFVGNVGSEVVDFTALGDAVNVAARLQASAGPGQLVVAADLLDGLDELLPAGEPHELEVRGRDGLVPVLVVSHA